MSMINNKLSSIQPADFSGRVRINLGKLAAELKSYFDFIVCGSGPLVARRFTKNPDANVLPVQADGSEGVPSVMDQAPWFWGRYL